MSSDPGVGQPEPGTSVPRSKLAAVLRRDAQLGLLETQIRGSPGYCAFENSAVPRCPTMGFCTRGARGASDAPASRSLVSWPFRRPRLAELHEGGQDPESRVRGARLVPSSERALYGPWVSVWGGPAVGSRWVAFAEGSPEPLGFSGQTRASRSLWI